MKILLFAFITLILTASCKKDDPAAKKIASISISPSSPSVAVGGTQQLIANIEPADVAQKEVIWISNDQKIATVDAAGLVTGLAKGTTTITAVATDGSNVKGTVTVNITTVHATSIAIKPPNPSVGINEKLMLTVAVAPVEANQTVTWSSSNPDKATVDATSGEVTGVALGSTVITAAAADGSNVKGTITVNIIIRATSITIMPASPSVGIGENITLTVAVTPSEASKAMTWTSSNPDKATIEASTGIATGVAIGATTITAAAADGSGVIQTTTLTVTSTDTAIALGDENFIVAVPVNGTAILANAPRTMASAITAVKVNIMTTGNPVIKIGTADFTQGQIVDFTNLVTFTVTAQNRTAESYTLGIAPYDEIANPYGIYTVKHLADVNNGLDKNYLLKNDIAMPGKDATDAATITSIGDYASAGWKPIGRGIVRGMSFTFNGTFDGGGFSINNFYINRATDKIGLFESTQSTGIIKNLGVNGVSGMAVTGKEVGAQQQSTGILVGRHGGTIDKCYATGNVSSSTSSYAAGGLVGSISGQGTISNSYATGNVSFAVHAGGLVGSISDHGTISNSYATGNVSFAVHAGGLVGRSSGRINNSYATGNVSSTGSVPSSTDTIDELAGAGGLVGYNYNTIIRNSYATGNVSLSLNEEQLRRAELKRQVQNYVGGLVGILSAGETGEIRYTNCYRNSDATIKKNGNTVTPDDNRSHITGITAKTRAEMQTDTFKGNLNGTSGAVWGRSDCKNDKFPYIIGVGAGG